MIQHYVMILEDRLLTRGMRLLGFMGPEKVIIASKEYVAVFDGDVDFDTFVDETLAKVTADDPYDIIGVVGEGRSWVKEGIKLLSNGDTVYDFEEYVKSILDRKSNYYDSGYRPTEKQA